MPVTDLSYARKRSAEHLVILGVETRGWNCGWALVTDGNPTAAGSIGARDHVDGKVVPQSHRIASLFGNLLEVARERQPLFIVGEAKAKPGPVWMLPPLLAMACGVRYVEMKDCLSLLNIDARSLKAWATVQLGKTPEDDLVAQALALATALSGSLRGHGHHVHGPGCDHADGE
ncbi:MAG: hypothetical protein HY815_00455 [Candidatus Riflebacteria bacterium]|nr:hypothetical protein [Candidatus Riflebacteria bacterium]